MLSPAAAAILSSMFMKESFGRYEMLAILFSLGGVLCIARPEMIFGMTEEEKNIYQSSNRILGITVGII